MCKEASILSSWSVRSSRCLDCEETRVIKVRFLFRRNNSMPSIQVIRIKILIQRAGISLSCINELSERILKEMYGNNKENSLFKLLNYLYHTQWGRHKPDCSASPGSTASQKILTTCELFFQHNQRCMKMSHRSAEAEVYSLSRKCLTKIFGKTSHNVNLSMKRPLLYTICLLRCSTSYRIVRHNLLYSSHWNPLSLQNNE